MSSLPLLILFPLIKIFSLMSKLYQLLKDELKFHISAMPFLFLPAVKRTSLFQELPWHFICNALMGYITVNLELELFVYIFHGLHYIRSPLRAGFCLIYLYIPKAPALFCMQQALNRYFWSKLKH